MQCSNPKGSAPDTRHFCPVDPPVFSGLLVGQRGPCIDKLITWEERIPTKRVDRVSAVDESERELKGAGAPPVTPRRWTQEQEKGG